MVTCAWCEGVAPLPHAAIRCRHCGARIPPATAGALELDLGGRPGVDPTFAETEAHELTRWFRDVRPELYP